MEFRKREPERFKNSQNEAFAGELDGICKQIDENLTQSVRISPQRQRNIGANLASQFKPFPVGLDGQHFRGFSERRIQIEIGFLQRQPARLDLGKIQDVVDDREQGPSAFAGARNTTLQIVSSI